MHYAETTIDSVPKMHGVSVAHSNLSVLEAWFSLVKNMKLDSGTSYESAVLNKQMRNACSLKNNGCYSASQAGEIAKERGLGPSEIIRFHADCDKQATNCVETHYYHELSVCNKDPTHIFNTFVTS